MKKARFDEEEGDQIWKIGMSEIKVVHKEITWHILKFWSNWIMKEIVMAIEKEGNDISDAL